MDSSTYIPLITAVTALIGALSPIIVAMIQLKREKQKEAGKESGILVPSNVVLHRQKTRSRWSIILIFAVVGGIIGYSGAKFIESSSDNLENHNLFNSNENAPGSINLSEYCQSLGFKKAVLENNNVYGWRCQASDGFLISIDVGEACKWKYEGSKPKPNFSNYGDPNSWMCYPN